eukprot:scaffold911_cov361-Prasinococcus_capsulatus_cf.AAC.20
MRRRRDAARDSAPRSRSLWRYTAATPYTPSVVGPSERNVVGSERVQPLLTPLLSLLRSSSSGHSSGPRNST